MFTVIHFYQSVRKRVLHVVFCWVSRESGKWVVNLRLPGPLRTEPAAVLPQLTMCKEEEERGMVAEHRDIRRSDWTGV